MTISRSEYALLCQDNYIPREPGKDVKLGTTYKILDYINAPRTGYQGTAYQRLDTHEVVIVSRGTEPNWNDIGTDAGMVLTGLNAQRPVANAFAARIEEEVKKQAQKEGYPIPPITVAGHSLGGTLAQLLAHEHHWEGVTFNAYGAADLGYHIPRGGNLVTNYVRATDVVSAASEHFGKVVVVATADDVRQLEHHGYHNRAAAYPLRNPLGAINLAAHSITNFVDRPDRRSDLSAESEALARAHQSSISLYREDIHDLRANVFSLAWRMEQKRETALALGGATATALFHGDRDTAEKLADLAAHRTIDNLGYAAHITTNTAMLGITAIDQAGAYVADNVKQGVHALDETAAHVAHAFNHAFTYVADHLKHDVHQLAQSAQQTMQPLLEGVAHHANAARGVPVMPAKSTVSHKAAKPLAECESASTPSVEVTAITSLSSIDAMFDALYQASVAQDNAAVSAVSEAYMQSPHGQKFLQQGREYNQQLERQQAKEQQIVRKGPAMSR